ncbi:MAG: beta-galactosidase [Clostridia bacterium]|nr:beta-galactosidase [Clostridia bacterium]MBQ1966384.1 beta-galactosidase [Clostridia bacterium]
MHYFRTLPEYWEDRLLKLKLAGFNTVETYVCWNLHEPKKGEYNFSGLVDIVRFIETAKKVGLYAIVRPGPYICAEWEFGGFPAWLLKDKNIELRCNNELYLSHVRDYFEKLFDVLRPHLITNGGNIIAMQIENEYGSYGNDKKYLEALKKMYADLGVDVLTFTSDGTWCNMLSGGTIDGVLPTLNFGSRTASAFGALEPFGKVPKMCMEFWCGWFDHWGEKHHTRGADSTLKEIEEFLKQGASFNMYMFHGGTNFGFNAGSNHNKGFAPTVTSYDYCAPLTEWGDYTETYHKIRKLLCEKQNIPLTELPPSPEMQNVGKVALDEKAYLFENLDSISKKHYSPLPRSMEAYDQSHGLIYYTTKLKGKYSGAFLSISDVHDYAHVYFDKKKIATIDRMKEKSFFNKLKLKKQLYIGGVSGESELGILVDAMGRVNYGAELNDRKGISKVMLANQTLMDYTVHTIPLDNLHKLGFKKASEGEVKKEPVFLKGHFKAGEGDCFVNMKGFTKGYVFVNGFNLGRYWDIGPQRALYLPGTLLKEENEIIVFELENYKNPEVTIQDKPDLG